MDNNVQDLEDSFIQEKKKKKEKGGEIKKFHSAEKNQANHIKSWIVTCVFQDINLYNK